MAWITTTKHIITTRRIDDILKSASDRLNSEVQQKMEVSGPGCAGGSADDSNDGLLPVHMDVNNVVQDLRRGYLATKRQRSRRHSATATTTYEQTTTIDNHTRRFDDTTPNYTDATIIFRTTIHHISVVSCQRVMMCLRYQKSLRTKNCARLHACRMDLEE
jgi:hypothetical protein